MQRTKTAWKTITTSQPPTASSRADNYPRNHTTNTVILPALLIAGAIMILLALCVAWFLYRRARVRKRDRTATPGSATREQAISDARQLPELHGDAVQELGAENGMVELHGSVQQAVELPADSSSNASTASIDSNSSIRKLTTLK